MRSSDSNVIEVVDNTYKTLERIQTQLPAGMTAKVVVDSSKGIRGSIRDVARTIIEGAILAVLIVLLFLRFIPFYRYYRIDPTNRPTRHTHLYLGIWLYHQHDDLTGALAQYWLID